MVERVRLIVTGRVQGVDVSIVDESETIGFGSVFRVVR